MFEVGDKVICVVDSINPGFMSSHSDIFMHWVKKGKTYTIRGFVDNDGIVVGVLLEECYNFPIYQPLLGREQEPAFATWRFVKKESQEATVEEMEEEELLTKI